MSLCNVTFHSQTNCFWLDFALNMLTLCSHCFMKRLEKKQSFHVCMTSRCRDKPNQISSTYCFYSDLPKTDASLFDFGNVK